jgi:hypothetical protein
MFLITGATGVVGTPLVASLRAAGVPFRIAGRGMQADALEGVSALCVHPRAVRDAAELVAQAAERGVARVVVMSAINVDDEPAHQPSRFNGDRNKEVEEAVVRGMIRFGGLTEPFVQALMGRYARGVGQPAIVTGEVAAVLGRPARTFAEWVADHAAAFTGGAER